MDRSAVKRQVLAALWGIIPRRGLLATAAVLLGLSLGVGTIWPQVASPSPALSASPAGESMDTELTTPDEQRATLFVGIVSTKKGRPPGGAWFGNDGDILAIDEHETAALAACPGDELVVQVVATPDSEGQEALLRDLGTLDVLERFPLPTGLEAFAAACRDEVASDIIIAAEEGIYDARAGEQVVEILWDREGPLWLSDRIAVGRGQDEGAVAVDLDSGNKVKLDRRFVYAYASDRDVRHVAILGTSSRPGEPSVLTVKRIDIVPDGLELVDIAQRKVPANFITRYSADEARAEPAYLTWLDDRLAYVRGQKPDAERLGRGRVTVLGGSDLSVLCRSRGWNVAPLAGADGTLIGVHGPYRTVRTPPEDRTASVMF